MERNVEKLNELADFIEKMEFYDGFLDSYYGLFGVSEIVYFNMSEVYGTPNKENPGCGTTACIWGTAKALWETELVLKEMGLTKKEGDSLFAPSLTTIGHGGMGTITQKEAASCLRYLTEGYTVAEGWMLALKGYLPHYGQPITDLQEISENSLVSLRGHSVMVQKVLKDELYINLCREAGEYPKSWWEAVGKDPFSSPYGFIWNYSEGLEWPTRQEFHYAWDAINYGEWPN